MRRHLALAATVAAVLASAASGAGVSDATLRLELRVDTSKSVFAEGALYFIVLRRPGFRVARLFKRSTLSLRVHPGRYVLRSYAQPCDGNCGSLDPPTDACRTRLTLRSSAITHIRVLAVPGSPCRLRARG